MALVDSTWYANSVAYAAVPAFAISTAYSAGQCVRQLATPTVGNERVFICIVAGTSAGSEPSWTLTRGAKTVSNTATFQECTGQAALNGDLVNTQTWAAVKAATPAVLGQIIKRSNNASYQICTTAGAMSASEPAFSDTAGVTTTDTTAVWTSLGAVGSYTGGMAPFARLQSVYNGWAAVGNTVFVSSNHAETQASAMTFTIGGSSAGLINRIMCHAVAGGYPPTSADLTTGATISTSATNAMTITIGGSTYFRGLTFKSGVGGASGGNMAFSPNQSNNQEWFYFDNCSLQIANTASGARIGLGTQSNTDMAIVTLNNTTVSFAHAAQYVWAQQSQVLWQNTGQILAAGSTVPTALFDQGSNFGPFTIMVFEAVDLSQIAGKIFSSQFNVMGSVSIRDCKLHASMTLTTPLMTNMFYQLSRSSA